MSKQGFTVTKHYLGFDTAWRAEFTHGKGGRVIGLQSEMDALPKIGHACGHNLIAISGVAVAVGLKAALEHHNVDGKIVLLGTPGMYARPKAPRPVLMTNTQLRNTVVERLSSWSVVRTRIWTSV